MIIFKGSVPLKKINRDSLTTAWTLTVFLLGKILFYGQRPTRHYFLKNFCIPGLGCNEKVEKTTPTHSFYSNLPLCSPRSRLNDAMWKVSKVNWIFDFLSAFSAVLCSFSTTVILSNSSHIWISKPSFLL